MKNWNLHDFWYYQARPMIPTVLSIVALILSIIALILKLIRN